ncbi:hypothetical protein LZ198_27105 [Myxococcus sp. K15C18031901]|uniref:hypothetical protein n=1 Tax=Myxococcus dinghuensis TaxID=2906761 RepID=UPI0020A6FE80|nr:hypothetical protein [Myxococcus dinghuensis]MCP3102548.1 hypothetical protein [Myxococcus dinghuensis]
MTWTFPPRLRALALTSPALAALLMPALATAAEPSQPTIETKEFVHDGDVTGNPAGSIPGAGINGAMRAADVGIHATGGLPRRDVEPDEDRMRELSGSVVKVNGQVLYVLTRPGAVVPVDLSALPLREMPRQGDQVVATYQVENRVENVALALQGRHT